MFDDLYITHYCHPDCEPFKSITRLPADQAYDFAAQLAKNRGVSFYRFGDFDNYYKRRIYTESWLYNAFINLGGKPVNRHPLYFVLNESGYLDDWFGCIHKISILLNKIDLSDISFTFGDSMSRMYSGKPLVLLNKENLFEYLKDKLDNNLLLYENVLRCEQIKYIEVQLWNDIYIEQQ